MRVLLCTEGTYPYVRGGVSTWVDQLVNGMPQHHFEVAAVVDNPIYKLAYDPPPNAHVMPVPLWGLELVDEYSAVGRGTRRALATTRRAIARRFAPVWEMFITQLVGPTSPDYDALGAAVATLAYVSMSLDLRAALRDPSTFDVLMSALSQRPEYAEAPLGQTIDFAQSLYRFLLPLTVDVPPVDIAHTSAAAICALPAIVAKYRHDVPLVVSEHGVYLRERLLALATANDTYQALYARFYEGLVSLAYAEATVIAPVCDYNRGWELELGADDARIEVIHNGVDPDGFTTQPLPDGPPVIGFVGRLDPLKDVECLLNAVALLAPRWPGLRLRIWGPDSDPAYAARCRARAAAPDLASVVSFEGMTTDPSSAYAACHVVVSSSISEGFPYGVIEAMLCGRAVVATDVGGVAEALGDGGITVAPREPVRLALAIDTLLDDGRDECAARGRRLRQRAMSEFSAEQCISSYDRLYHRLAAQPEIV